MIQYTKLIYNIITMERQSEDSKILNLKAFKIGATGATG
jgi:hypothetical protein